MTFHFANLVESVSAEIRYERNEPELSLPGLNQTLAELHQANERVIQAEVNLAYARKKRNEVMYFSEGSLFNTAMAAKLYVRGIFGYLSPEHHDVTRIRFTKPTL